MSQTDLGLLGSASPAQVEAINISKGRSDNAASSGRGVGFFTTRPTVFYGQRKATVGHG